MLKHGIYIACLFACLASTASCTQRERAEAPLTICFTGDVLLDRGVREQIEKKGVDYLFEGVASVFRSSDAVIVNLECPVTDTVSPVNKQYVFRAEPTWVSDLYTNGITHAALANNHTMDQGRRGLESTAYHVRKAGIIPIGYGVDQEMACQPVFVSARGIEAAIFNSVLIPIENWMYLTDKPGVCQATVEELIPQIESLKKKKPNCYIFVNLHWGIEYQETPTIKQRKEAYRLINAGADAIIGHHPHVIQKEEYYKGKPVYYSLGNFVFDQTKPGTTKGLLLQITCSNDGISYRPYTVDIEKCKPVVRQTVR